MGKEKIAKKVSKKAGKPEETTPKRTGVKRKVDAIADVEEESEKSGKKEEKILSRKKLKRKEVTALYSELISPGRERKADAIVEDILGVLANRAGPSPLVTYCSSEIGSKVVQACLKWGTRAQRRLVLSQLKDHLAKMAVDKFGHVVVTKLLRYGARTAVGRTPTSEEKKAQAENLRNFLDAFHGKGLKKAFYHKHGCRVVNDIYFSEHISTKEKRLILHEVAVPPAVSLLRPELPGTGPTLRQLLGDEGEKALSKEQRTACMSHLQDALDKAIDKELLGVEITHLLFQAYCERASERELRELADKAMAGAPYLLSSKPGAEALLYLLGVANAKERKSLCKELKGKFVALATNPVDYLFMMRFVSTVDDTVLLEKTVLSEWQADLETLCFDKYGNKVLAWIFRPGDAKVFSPYDLKCLTLPAPSSLKASEKRHQELTRTLRPAVGTVLKAGALKAASTLHAKDLLVAYLRTHWDAEVLEALIADCEAAAGESDSGLAGTAVTTLQALLKHEHDAGDVSKLTEPLWRRCFQPRLLEIALSRAAFLLQFLVKLDGATGKAVKAAVVKQSKKLEAAVKAAESEGKTVNAARKLLEVVK